MAIEIGSVTIEIYPAGHGDAALVSCRHASSSCNILIDGGVRSTFVSHLEPRLRDLRSRGERLDLVVVTHIDTDHIAGILELLKANGPSSNPNVIEIGEIWHNGYRHLELGGRNATESEKQKVLSQVPSLSAAESAEGRISVKEAEALASLITKHGYPWNTSFDGKAALAGGKISLHGIVEITILSPRREELKELGAVWKRGIMSKGVSREAVVCDEFEVAFELEMPLVSEPEPDIVDLISANDADTIPDPSSFREDRSPINASSIALLIECAGRRLLFLGDSWPSVIVAHLQQSASAASPARCDAMKVSHHGSNGESTNLHYFDRREQAWPPPSGGDATDGRSVQIWFVIRV
jgi:ribonuclease BN (tRNA processing enzyme)